MRQCSGLRCAGAACSSSHLQSHVGDTEPAPVGAPSVPAQLVFGAGLLPGMQRPAVAGTLRLIGFPPADTWLDVLVVRLLSAVLLGHQLLKLYAETPAGCAGGCAPCSALRYFNPHCMPLLCSFNHYFLKLLNPPPPFVCVAAGAAGAGAAGVGAAGAGGSARGLPPPAGLVASSLHNLRQSGIH